MGTSIIITDYAAQRVAISVVRDEVFVIEQAIDREEEYDSRDSVCTHVVVFEGGLPVATGRIDLEKDGKIGRVAVRKAFRKLGLGTMVMSSLEEFGEQNGARRLWFHAQVQAIPFYEKLGYRVCSEAFEEANIPHVLMEKSLVADPSTDFPPEND